MQFILFLYFSESRLFCDSGNTFLCKWHSNLIYFYFSWNGHICKHGIFLRWNLLGRERWLRDKCFWLQMEKTSFMIGPLQSMIFLDISSLFFWFFILWFFVFSLFPWYRLCLFYGRVYLFLFRVLCLIHFLKLIPQRRTFARVMKGIQFLTLPCHHYLTVAWPIPGNCCHVLWLDLLQTTVLDQHLYIPILLIILTKNACYVSRGMHFDSLLRCRRLYRKQILKKKRELGLINIANSKVIRYKQKQTTAMQKNRCNGKFASVMCSVW